MCLNLHLQTNSDVLVEEMLSLLPLSSPKLMNTLKRLIQNLHAYEQRSFLSAVLRYLSRSFLADNINDQDLSASKEPSPNIAGCAALIQELTCNDNILLEALSELCIKLEGNVLTGSHSLQRAVIAALANDEGM